MENDSPPAAHPDEEVTLPAPPEDLRENRFWEHGGRTPGKPNAKTQITHEMLADFMIANPRATRREIAAAFGWRSEASVSIIMNSDAFQAAYARRRAANVDPVMVASVEDRIKQLASRSAELLSEELEKSPSTKLVMEVFRESTRAGSYGVKAPVAVQTQFVVALPGPATNSQEWLERFAPNQAGVVKPRLDDAPVEVQAREVK
jgi:hypothetical protein